MQQIDNGAPADLIEGATWRKSSRSAPGGNCVELATLPGDTVAVRNSRFPSGPALVYGREEVAALIAGIKDGEFDELAN